MTQAEDNVSIPKEQQTARNPSQPDHERMSFDESAYGQQRAFERTQEWLDEVASIKLAAIRLAWQLTTPLLAVLVMAVYFLVVLIVTTFAVHLFIPQVGWLTAEQQDRLTGWYSDVAQVALPAILVTNSWLIWLMSRRRRD